MANAVPTNAACACNAGLEPQRRPLSPLQRGLPRPVAPELLRPPPLLLQPLPRPPQLLLLSAAANQNLRSVQVKGHAKRHEAVNDELVKSLDCKLGSSNVNYIQSRKDIQFFPSSLSLHAHHVEKQLDHPGVRS